jgi:hypothetical protein
MHMLGKKSRLLLLVAFFTSCSHVCLTPQERDVQDEMTHAVKIHAEIVTKRLHLNTGKTEEAKAGWVGSGVVLATGKNGNKDVSLVMTAGHIVEIPLLVQGEDENGPFLDFLKPDTLKISVITLDGSVCDAHTLKADFVHDVSTLVVDCIAGKPTSLGDELPPKGGDLHIVGAPAGIHPVDSFVVTDGMFIGLDGTANERLITTVPVVGGSSGSGVFYRGHVVGIVSRVYEEFHHISQMVNLKWCQKLYYESLLTLHERERAPVVPSGNP